MASKFDTEFAEEAAADLLAEFGEPVVVFAGGENSGRTITAIVSYSETEIDEVSGERHDNTGSIKFLLSESVLHLDRISIAGEDYQVLRSEKNNAGFGMAYFKQVSYKRRTVGSKR